MKEYSHYQREEFSHQTTHKNIPPYQTISQSIQEQTFSSIQACILQQQTLERLHSQTITHGKLLNRTFHTLLTQSNQNTITKSLRRQWIRAILQHRANYYSYLQELQGEPHAEVEAFFESSLASV